MIEETGYCKGIENYSRHFDCRAPGQKPYCLLDYFPQDFLLFIDESHQTIPQLNGMYKGDRSRKKALVDYGFRLPSAYDNRPLRFQEFEGYMRNVVFVSATPGPYEATRSARVAEQIVRPTGLLEPVVTTRPIEGQTTDVIRECEKTIARGDRCLVMTLTKRLAEELADYLSERGIRSRYLHSEIETIERTEIIRELGSGSSMFSWGSTSSGRAWTSPRWGSSEYSTPTRRGSSGTSAPSSRSSAGPPGTSTPTSFCMPMLLPAPLTVR